MSHCCKVKSRLCSVQQVWWSLHWGLWQGWASGLWGFRSCWCVEISRGGGSSQQPQRTEPCQCVIGQSWACHGVLQGQMQPLLCAAGVVGPALGAAAGLGRWFVGVAVLPFCGNLQRRRQYSATTAHRALPVCEWPALSTTIGKARSNAGASALRSRCGGACTGSCYSAGQGVCGVYGFAGEWRFPEEEAAPGNHSAQRPASV